MADALTPRLKRLRHGNKNFRYQHFVPELELYSFMQTENIRAALSILQIESYHLEELVKEIRHRARKVFAILLLIGQGHAINLMFKHDSLQASSLDDKLPLEMSQLNTILGDESVACDFFEKQWEFITPVFSRTLLPRTFHGETILPIMSRQERGEGSFGVVLKLNIHPNNERFALPTSGCVGKVIKFENTDKKYHRELRNLSLLTQLKHPNIVELLCCYSHQNVHTFLFPAAEHGNLEDLLEMPERSVHFEADETFLVSLAQLASGLDAMHNFFAEMLDIRLTGYHHDLAPKNILVDGSRLMLADFGLSNFKDSTEQPSTSFKNNQGYYVAPECVDLEGKWRKPHISQESDIWSFGCILLVVFVYMKNSLKGVEQFEEDRKYETPEFIWRRFHRGPGRESPAVLNWLDKLRQNAARHEQQLLDLISVMLSVTPAQRPKSGRVLDQLHLIAVAALSRTVESLYARRTGLDSHIEAYVESKRFDSWRLAFEAFAQPSLLESSEETRTKYPSIIDFEQIIRTLESIKDLVAVGGKLDGQRDGWETLRSFNSSLLNTLPHPFRSQAHSLLQIRLLQTQNTNLLEATKEAMGTPSGDEMISVLAAIKSMTIQADEHLSTDGGNLRIKLADVILKEAVGHHNLATLDTPSGTPQNVLVESLEYDSTWSRERVGRILFSRIESITKILTSPDVNKMPAVLQSCGFFHDPGKRVFGQVYNLPSSCGKVPKAVSLKDIFQSRDPLGFPSLEDRLGLAHTLVSAILVFHQIPWLHKALNASNILFFPAEGARPENWIRNPYIVGFMHSRKNELNPFTNGPQGEHRNYQHPTYLHDETATYKPEFDYYSLGMLLLEIGIWDPLNTIVGSQNFRGIGDQVFRQRVLERKMAPLRHRMGSRYADAARVCLESGFDSSGDPSTLYGSFRRLVVDVIADCRV